MSTNVHLTPALEAFARECVESGQYNSVSEVVREGLRILQGRAEARRAFTASLLEASAEAERVGCKTIEEVMVEIDAIVEAAER